MWPTLVEAGCGTGRIRPAGFLPRMGLTARLYNAQKMVNREDAAAESWRKTLGGIPTVIGRLAYLASLRNVHTGHYEHVGLAQRIGEDTADRIIRRSHTGAFHEWLCFGLERQKQELDDYLSDQEGDKSEVISGWVAIEPWHQWVPAESRDVERKLFSADLAVILELIRTENGVASRDPDS